MKVKRYNYPAQFATTLDDLVGRIRAVLLGGTYILGEDLERFERDFARYLGVQHVAGVNSGTDALIMALRVLGIGPHDEVITHANTFHATVAAIQLTGATPILVDADPSSFLIDEAQMAAAITPRTRALLPVHLYGKPTPMETLLGEARRHGLHVIEDAAQAHGAAIGSRRAGTLGDVGCFSFHPSKNLAAAGDGGALVTDSATHHERILWYRGLGQRAQNEHVVVGLNSKLDVIQALVLASKLPRLDEWNRRRATIARRYRERLQDLPVYVQATDVGETHVYHLFQVGTPDRDGLLHHLRAAGVDATVRYPVPIHLQPAFVDRGWRTGQFPVAERLARELLCLPIRPDMTEDEIDYVADHVGGFFAGGRSRAVVPAPVEQRA
jgi:dTDP-4-amino-4,6-dideoxygalactose transaminase